MNKRELKIFLIISIGAVLLVVFFVFFILHEKHYIINNGKDFEAKCVDVYKRKRSTKNNRNRIITIYVFEVTSPNEIKGKRFEKARSKYQVGRTYKGKYIINKNKNIFHNEYEYQIIE